MKNLTDKSILVIDDDPGMLRALDKVLSSEGATVTCAKWAGDAMEVLSSRKKQFDLVITDLRMPFVNGMTVVYSVHVIFPALPVIVLTAFATPEVKAACHDEGAVAVLEKPLDSQELISAVRKALQLETPDFCDKPEQPGESERRKSSQKPNPASRFAEEHHAAKISADRSPGRQNK